MKLYVNLDDKDIKKSLADVTEALLSGFPEMPLNDEKGNTTGYFKILDEDVMF